MKLHKYLITAAVGSMLMTALPVAWAAQHHAMSRSVKPIVQPWAKAKFGGLEVLPSCSSFAVARGNPMTGPSMLIVKAKAGCVVPWHWHSVREELMIVSGQAKVDIADFGTRVVHQGDYVMLPARHHHQFECRTDCVFFDATSGKFDIHYIDRAGKEIPAKQALQAVSEKPGASK